jgi:hypothetical protein
MQQEFPSLSTNIWHIIWPLILSANLGLRFEKIDIANESIILYLVDIESFSRKNIGASQSEYFQGTYFGLMQ